MEEEFIISLMKKGKMSISTISIYQSNIVFLFQNLKKTKDVSLDWLGSWENLSIKPELEEAFARQAENAANLERELVGAGARASAESGQAFAQHGDDVARGLEAVSGGAASRVSREFSS